MLLRVRLNLFNVLSGFLIWIGFGLPFPLMAAPVVVDLSSDLIAVDVSFDGDEVLMFGAVDAPLSDKPLDLIVTIMGPRETFALRKKSRIAGVWINSSGTWLEEVPSFYRLASTRPLESILTAEKLRTIDAVPEHLSANLQDEAHADLRQAFVRNMETEGLYTVQENSVVFLSNRLFRVPLTFPSNVSTGDYHLMTHLIQEGEVVFSVKTPFAVRKVGQEAALYNFAHGHALLYGVLCVLLAIIWGYASDRIFRRF